MTENLPRTPRSAFFRRASLFRGTVLNPILIPTLTLVLTVALAPKVKAQPEPKQTATGPQAPKAAEPFAFADFTWLNGNSRQTELPLATKYFTGQFSIDTNYVYSLNRPKDHTLAGSSNSGRTGEFQVQHIGVGGDFNYQNVRGRLMTQLGMYSTMTPASDASPSRGQWQLANAYRYVSEAYAGYHWDYLHGVNLDVGIFLSYLGLPSYYNYENWAYQMSYVSASTPWFFNGMRLQIFPTDRLKLELWLVNGWQAYGAYNEQPGLGAQVLYRPTESVSFLSNNYYGADTLNQPGRGRFHTDNSVQLKYYDKPANFLNRAAFSLTVDAGCEDGGGVSCQDQYFLGFMLYNRIWFDKSRYAVTLGGGAVNNPGRYLALLPPVNGATASSGTASFTQNPGDSFRAWDASATFDYMPNENITWRAEFIRREANVDYFAGGRGLTGDVSAGFVPDLVKSESRFNFAMMVRL